MNPPLSVILFASISSDALCSSVNLIAVPFRANTALASPTLAVYKCLLSPFPETIQVTEVHP